MPVHRVVIDAELEQSVADIEKRERIIGVEKAGDGCLLVFTEAKVKRAAPGEKETRCAS